MVAPAALPDLFDLQGWEKVFERKLKEAEVAPEYSDN
jgi:hypothetical protein